MYGASAIASAILCIAIISGATSLVFPLLLVLVIIGVLIAWQKHREINVWLSKCIFGTGGEQFSPQDERKQFEALTS
jgi:membrane-associated PAP2 superfamily phosphatase